MANNARDIRRRIRATKNMAQITRALQQVATSRLRRAQARVSDARPYAESIRDVLAGLCHAAERRYRAPAAGAARGAARLASSR